MDLIFENNINENDDFEFKDDIIIFSEKNGRKTNSYLIKWDIDKNEKKEHLKNLKRKHGCNGSIKIKNFQGTDYESIHLQGDFKEEIKEYLLSKNINEETIEIKI